MIQHLTVSPRLRSECWQYAKIPSSLHLKLVDQLQVEVVEVGLSADTLHHEIVGQPGVVVRVVLDVRLDLRNLARINHKK